MDPREERLPGWAKTIISQLREEVVRRSERLQSELNSIQLKYALALAKNSAMIELLECAATGKHLTATAIMEIIRAYGLELVKEN